LTAPAPGQVGNLGLRWIEGPGRFGLDVSLAKRIQIRESTSFTVRADAVNALNTPIWNDPNVDINNVNFGRITSTVGGSPRTITMSARIDF
jgi:hypothetical protein